LKILISPTFLITKKYLTKFFENIIVNKLKLKKSHKIELINGELNHYGEITNILGKENVFFTDEIHPIYIKELSNHYLNDTQNIKLVEAYPSNFNFDQPSYITNKEVYNNKIFFDFAIFSIKSFEKNYELISFLKKNKTTVVLFDKLDDLQIYFKGNNYEISKSYNHKYDIIFKQDIPSTNTEQNVFPIAPIPSIIHKKNYENINKKLQTKNFYFSGDYRKNQTRKDRFDIVNFINKEFENNVLNLTIGRKVFFSKVEQDNNLINSKINISASGKVWDSYRHCELANFYSPILLPNPDCKTAPGKFEDMKNCIIYETEKIENDFILKNTKSLKEKLEFLINNKTAREKMYQNYFELIQNFHTRKKRASYILYILKNYKKNNNE
tara:strand:- start:592 stop:1740 length:1149 start_codon:yes stop_codon:yes gene_type:complete